MATELVEILKNWILGCLVINILFPFWNMTGAKTKITNAQRKKAISKMWISCERYLTALCIITKNKPEIIIKPIAINDCGILLEKSLMIFIEYNDEP